tara:strand:+ start:1311 stop:1703 length:393 start_codon:yes stop_codon:yes gene_type:complete
MVNIGRLQAILNDMAVTLDMQFHEDREYTWEGSREDAKELVMYASPDEMTSVITELYFLIEQMDMEFRDLQEEHEDEESEKEPRQGPNDPMDLEPDHSYVRECMAETSGDDMSKADYMEYYSRMGMEGDY